MTTPPNMLVRQSPIATTAASLKKYTKYCEVNMCMYEKCTDFWIQGMSTNLDFYRKRREGNLFSLLVCSLGGTLWSCPAKSYPGVGRGKRYTYSCPGYSPYPTQDGGYKTCSGGFPLSWLGEVPLSWEGGTSGVLVRTWNRNFDRTSDRTRGYPQKGPRTRGWKGTWDQRLERNLGPGTEVQPPVNRQTN